LVREEGEEADGDRERDGSSATGPAEAAAASSSSKASGQWENVRWARSTRPTAAAEEEEMEVALGGERRSGGRGEDIGHFERRYAAVRAGEDGAL
jgi:hypothetical protein